MLNFHGTLEVRKDPSKVRDHFAIYVVLTWKPNRTHRHVPENGRQKSELFLWNGKNETKR